MKYIIKRNRMSGKTPPIIAPIIDLLKYNGNTTFGEQLLLGTDTYLPYLHDHTNIFLKQII